MTEINHLGRMADFDLTDTQRQVRLAVREFAEREILPTVEQNERDSVPTLDVQRRHQLNAQLRFVTSTRSQPAVRSHVCGCG